MPIKSTKVKTHRITYKCDSCGLGDVSYTGNCSKLGFVNHYIHYCHQCQQTHGLNTIYPYFEYVDVVDDTNDFKL